MTVWFWMGVGAVAWLVIGAAVAWVVGRSFGRPVPLREEPDLWGDVELEPWPHEDDRRAA